MNDYLVKILVNGVSVVQKVYADMMKDEENSLDFYFKGEYITSYSKKHVTMVIEMNQSKRGTEIIYKI